MPRDLRRTGPGSGWAVLAGAAAFALVAGWSAGRYFSESSGERRVEPPDAQAQAGTSDAAAPEAPLDVLHRPRPDFDLPDLDGRRRGPDEWKGRVLVLNFWATWCAPCREEIPLLMDLERRRPEVRVVGIALDTVDAVRAFAKELGIGYPLLLDDARGSTMRRYGNRLGALPFTVVTGPDGTVAFVRLGVLDPGELDTAVAALR